VANFATRRSALVVRGNDRGPIQCAVPDCPGLGTMTESTTHEDPRDVRWYCREHWDLRGDPQKAHQLAMQMRRMGRSLYAGHWADIEVEERMANRPDESHQTARQYLDQLRAAVGRHA